MESKLKMRPFVAPPADGGVVVGNGGQTHTFIKCDAQIIKKMLN